MFRAPRARGRLGRRRYRERLRCRPEWGLHYRHRAWGRQNSSSKGHRHPKSWGCPHCRCHRRHCFHLERRFCFPSQKQCPPPNRKRSPRPRRRSPRQTHRWSLRLPEPRAQQGKHSMPHQRRKTPPPTSPKAAAGTRPATSAAEARTASALRAPLSIRVRRMIPHFI